jgi:hemerythrin-like domain-containing protein
MAYLPQRLSRLSPLAYPSADIDEEKIPSMDLHPRQPRGRDARERVIRTLKTEHGNIGKLLDTVIEELGSSAGGAIEKPNYLLITGILDYLHSYSDGFHHPREDLLFEHLGKRLPELEPAMEALLEEHQWLDAEGQKLEQALNKHLKGPHGAERNPRLNSQCRRYVKKLKAHLHMEETEVFTRTEALQRHDWMAIDKGLAYQPDPLFGWEVQQRYEELADALAGRVEGFSASMALKDVIGLETIASGFDALGTGLTRLRKQGSEQLKARWETQRTTLQDSLDKPSLTALIGLPFRLLKANGELTRENVRANYDTAREIMTDVKTAVRQARGET